MYRLLLIFIFTISCSLYSKEVKSSYRKGHYRFVAEQVQKKKNPKPKELYILGQSSLELRRTNDAWRALSTIDYKTFQTNPDTSFLYPFFVEAYLRAGFAQNMILQPILKNADVLKMVALVPAQHPIKSSIDDKLLAFLWKEKNYAAMMMANTNLSVQGKVWIELAKFAQGLPYQISTVTDSWRQISDPQVYEDLLNTIDPKQITNQNQARVLAEISIKIPMLQDKAVAFGRRHAELSKNNEIYTMMRYHVLTGRRDNVGAAKLLYQHILKEKNVSLTFFRLAQSRLIRLEMLAEAMEIGRKAYAQYQDRFSTEYAVVLESQKNHQAILAWYKKNYKNVSEEVHNQVFRSLIRSTNLQLAESALDLGYEANQKYASYHLMRALVKERLGKNQEAYKSYLEAWILEPFGYPGITAAPKEREMRNTYRSDFDARVASIHPLLTSAPIQKRLLYAKAFSMDLELQHRVDKNRMKQDQAEHDTLILKGLEIDAIPELENLNLRLTNYGPEMQDFIENAVKRAVSKSSDPSAMTKYYFRYRKLFTDTEIIGYLTFRLFFYLRDLYGNNTYIPIFSQDMMKLIYPRPEWTKILAESQDNEDLAYWLLSSFHQESHFRKRVFSYVGAVGFAQVMGYTARDIKNWMRRPYMENMDFIDNLTMGIYYHKRMYELHDKNHVQGMAAYNAGPGRTRTWNKRYAAYLDNMPLYIEAIDIRETRIYVRIVSYNRAMYDIIYNKPELWPNATIYRSK